MPATRASLTISTAPSPGTSSPSLLERADLDVDTARCEDGAIDVAGACVCGVVVERLPLVVERPEGRLILRQRAVAAADATPGLLGVDLDEDRHGAISKRTADLVGPDRAAAQGDHGGCRRAQRFECVPRLSEAERRLASGLEDPRDRLNALDLAVHVDEGPSELLREELTERRLAGAHEADQGDVTV